MPNPIPIVRGPEWNTVEPRFWAKVQRTDGCWLWTDRLDHFGYGALHLGGHKKHFSKKAHRISWELHYGPIPDGLLVCHHCDNPRCVRPDHLFVGTHKDNRMDASAKGRLPANPVGQSRLTHCKRGHEFTPENTRLCKAPSRRTYRLCRACDCIRSAKKHYRYRAAEASTTAERKLMGGK